MSDEIQACESEDGNMTLEGQAGCQQPPGGSSESLPPHIPGAHKF